MTKKRTMNELRQTKDTHYVSPKYKNDDLLYTRPAVPKGAQYQGIANIHDTDESKWTVEDQKEYHSSKGKDIAGDEFMIKEAKDLIVNNLQNQFYDIIFEAVSNEMSKNYLFRQNNYLTEAGEELFEDAWFEWYHEHHGDILSRILKRLEP